MHETGACDRIHKTRRLDLCDNCLTEQVASLKAGSVDSNVCDSANLSHSSHSACELGGGLCELWELEVI